MKALYIIRYVAFILCFIAPVCASSQVSIRQVTKNGVSSSNQGIRDNIPYSTKTKSKPKSSKTKGKASSLSKSRKEVLPDTVYAFSTKKQYGWFSPLGTLTKEQVAHRYSSIRFTHRNNKGHWCKIETINSHEELIANGEFSPYILKTNSADTDASANQDWVEKLNTACIYELVTNPTGETVIQERAYNKDKNIVYIYSRTPIGKDKNGHNRFIGSYKDNYGMPAEMRNDSLYTYGTLVRLTEDQWGNDSIIEYLDAKGIRKANSDGVAMEAFIHNKDGELIKQQSRDSLGHLTIDNWGNCGILYTYNADHTIASATYMDDSWQPMRMPGNRQTGQKSVIQTKYTYDKYKRYTEKAYFTAENIPDKNAYGAHREVVIYDDYGNYTDGSFYDINGNFAIGDNVGYAQQTAIYNSQGLLLEAHWYDEKGNPLISDQYISCRKCDYDDNGEQILEERFSCGTDNVEYLVYKNEKRPNYEYTQWNDGSYRVDSLDSKGRTTFIGFYGKDKQPDMTDGRAFEKYTYQDFGKNTISTEVDYDDNWNKVNVGGIYKTVTKVDSIAWTMTKWRYDASDVLKETFVHRYSPNFKTLIGQDDTNAFGVVSRSGGSSGARYYKADVIYNEKNEFASISARDEFGEPDYIITSTNDLYCYMKMSPYSSTKYYGEDNKVHDADSLRDALAKIMTIEVVDSVAYAHGLRDNDVILLYGEYSANIDTIVSYYQFRKDWVLRSVLDARENKRMVVFRIDDASKGKFGLVEIKNLVGTPSELGFLTHVRFLTKKQRTRIQEAIANNISSTRPLLTKKDMNKPNYKGGNNYVLLAFPNLFRENRNYPYPKQVTDPTILLGAGLKSSNIKWTIDEGEETGNFDAILKATSSTSSLKHRAKKCFLTKDANAITTLTLTDQAPYTNWFNTYISDEDFVKLSSLYAQAKDSVESLCNTSTPIDKRLVGYWEIQPQSSDDQQVTGYLNLSEDGEVDGEITYYYYEDYQGFYPIYRNIKNYVGKWNSSDGWLSLSQSADSLFCVDVLSSSDSLNQNKYINDGLSNDFRISSLSRDSFTANDSIIFIKKNPPIYSTLWSEEQKDSIYDYAYTLWQKNEDIRAHHLFTRLSKAGYHKAYYPLSTDYLYGYGVQKDMQKAEQWDEMCRKDSNYAYLGTYHIAREYVKGNNHKKAKEYLEYLRKGKKNRSYNELMSQYCLQNNDTIKALKYLNDYNYYLYAENDSAQIVKLRNEYVNNYFVRYPQQAADGMAHLAYDIHDMGYYHDAISMFDKARSVKGDIETEQGNYETVYCNLLQYMANNYPEDYSEKFDSYIKDKYFTIEWDEDNPIAGVTGIKKTCTLLAYNDWNISQNKTPDPERSPINDDSKERAVTLYYKGHVYNYKYTGKDQFRIKVNTLSKKEKSELVEAYNKSL